jgi:ribose 5-phosphate isomerase B
MKILIASDHAGKQLSAFLVKELLTLGYPVEELTQNITLEDYPDVAALLVSAMENDTRGILICGSGVGICIAANKFKDIRAGLCHDCYSARQGVEHDNMNVLCIGERIVGTALALEIVKNFLTAKFSDVERYYRRLQKVKEIELQGNRRGMDLT